MPRELGHPPTDSILATCQGMYPLLEEAGVGEAEDGVGVEDGEGHVYQEVSIYSTVQM